MNPLHDRGEKPASEPLVVHERMSTRAFSAATATVTLVAIALIVQVIVQNGAIRWHVVGDYLFDAQIISGVGTTVRLAVFSFVVSIVIGTLLAMMRISTNAILRAVSGAYIWFFRGTPLLVQIIFWFNIGLFVPRIALGSKYLDVNQLITPLSAALLGLTLNVSAFMCEVIRGGLLSVDRGQTEAALSIGATPRRALLWIVLPQAIRVILPSAGNLGIDLLKATSLVSVIGTRDLLTTAEAISAQNFYEVELLFVACGWYLVLVTVASVLQAVLERRFSRGTGAAAVRPGSAPRMRRAEAMGIG